MVQSISYDGGGAGSADGGGNNAGGAGSAYDANTWDLEAQEHLLRLPVVELRLLEVEVEVVVSQNSGPEYRIRPRL